MRDARRDGRMRCTRKFPSRIASYHRASHRAMRFSVIFIAPRIARCEARGKNIAPRIARCEARCFFIVKRVRIFTAGVILLSNPLRANDHMAKISHFRLRQLHPRFYQELTAIFSLKSCIAVSFGVVHN